jgi:hypothetical protein
VRAHRPRRLRHRIPPSPPCRSQLTSLRERPDAHLDFPPLRELRSWLGAPARVGTDKLSNQLHHHHLSHHHSHHHSNYLCDDLARKPQPTALQSDASGQYSRMRRSCAEKVDFERSKVWFCVPNSLVLGARKFGSGFESEFGFAVCLRASSRRLFPPAAFRYSDEMRPMRRRLAVPLFPGWISCLPTPIRPVRAAAARSSNGAASRSMPRSTRPSASRRTASTRRPCEPWKRW